MRSGSKWIATDRYVGDNVAHAGDTSRLDRLRERDGHFVDGGIDSVGEHNDQGRVTGRDDAKGRIHRPCVLDARLPERPQQLLMDAAESAVRHEHDEIARPVIANNRLDDVLQRLRLAGRLAAAS